MKLAFKVIIMNKVCIFYSDFVMFHYATTSGIIPPSIIFICIPPDFSPLSKKGPGVTESYLNGARNDHARRSIEICKISIGYITFEDLVWI